MTADNQHHDFFSADGHLNDNGTSLYTEALLLNRPKELPDRITKHTESCELCKEQILGLYELMKEQPIDREMKHPYFDRRRNVLPFPESLRRAAVFLFALLTGSAFFLYSIRSAAVPPEPVRSEVPSDSRKDQQTPVPDADVSFAENFTPSPNLDDLVQSEFRSESIEVLMPVNDAIVHSPITFQWKHTSSPVILKVLNNRDITVLTSNVKTNRFVTAKSFAPGLYYWKLEENGELLYVGRFFVR